MSVAVNVSPNSTSLAASKRFAKSFKGIIFHKGWLAILMVLVIWQIISFFLGGRGLVPSPARTAATMWGVLASGEFFVQLGDSLVRLLIGFVLAMTLGMIVGVLMGSRWFWNEFFKDIVILGLSLPGLVYALLSVVIFGTKLLAPVMAILFASYPFIAVNIREGVKALDKDLLDMTQAYKIGKWKVVQQVIIPSLLPHILAAIRTGFTIAWKASVLTEVFGATSGIGYMIRFNFQMFAVRGILAWSLLFGGVMILIEYGILVPAERHFARWRPQILEEV
ncbi:MAG TPA: ABC transporter permease [Anaerolineae bacterium]|nr:ABC transporter permease [Anaerolineae bacterium]HCM96700.1 ABC transporter permease [Anaerolineae bacterium]